MCTMHPHSLLQPTWKRRQWKNVQASVEGPSSSPPILSSLSHHPPPTAPDAPRGPPTATEGSRRLPMPPKGPRGPRTPPKAAERRRACSAHANHGGGPRPSAAAACRSRRRWFAHLTESDCWAKSIVEDWNRFIWDCRSRAAAQGGGGHDAWSRDWPLACVVHLTFSVRDIYRRVFFSPHSGVRAVVRSGKNQKWKSVWKLLLVTNKSWS